jgi:hypothetical protein
MKTPRKPQPIQLLVQVTPKLKAVLDEIKRRDGLPLRAQMERAIVLWAKEKGIEVSL